MQIKPVTIGAAGAQPCGDGLARTGHTPQLFHPGGGSWCTDTPTGESSHCWRAAPPAAGAPAPPAYEQGQWQEKLHRKAMQVPKLETQCECPDGESDRIWTGRGQHVLRQPQTVHHSNQAIRRVKGSTIDNLSGKQARFKMTWANYYA